MDFMAQTANLGPRKEFFKGYTSTKISEKQLILSKNEAFSLENDRFMAQFAQNYSNLG